MRWACLILLFVAATVRAETITVAAAISLKEAMVDMGAAFNEETGDEVIFAFGASGQLLAQIRNGAPIDAFVSAAPDQVDALAKDKLTVPATRRVVAGNKLVLIVPAATKLGLKSIDDLKRPDVRKIALGEPRLVPAGAYAMQSLKHLHLAEALAGKIVQGTNVRQVLDYVERGEVDAGFVYATDAQQAGLRVKIVADAPPDSYDPVLYPAVVLSASKKQSTAVKFLDFMKTKRGRWILHKRRGFVLDPPATRPAAATHPATRQN